MSPDIGRTRRGSQRPRQELAREVVEHAGEAHETRRATRYNDAMELWVRKGESFAEDRAADREFWQQLTPDERVAAVEELRAQWAALTGARHEGFRRTVRVLARAER